MADRNAYFIGARTRKVTITLRLPIWNELEEATAKMRQAAPEFTESKMCAEIIESWAAERRLIALNGATTAGQARAEYFCL